MSGHLQVGQRHFGLRLGLWLGARREIQRHLRSDGCSVSQILWTLTSQLPEEGERPVRAVTQDLELRTAVGCSPRICEIHDDAATVAFNGGVGRVEKAAGIFR